VNSGALAAFRMPSASSMDRADRCPPSHWLPLDRITSPYAIGGNGVHDFIVCFFAVYLLDKAAGVAPARKAALEKVPKVAPHRGLCEALPLEALPEGGKLELAFAYNPQTDTARVLGVNIGRAYSEHGALPHEICGTADCVGKVGDVLHIYDWKSGWLPVGAWQLRFLALAAARALGMSRVRVANWYLREDGRIFEDDDSVAEFDALDLDDIADDVRRVLSKVGVSQGLDEGGHLHNLSAGDWCRWCECKASCRLQVGLVKASFGMELREPLTIEAATEAWLVLDQVEDSLKLMRNGLKEFARTNPFPVGDGKQMQETDWPFTEIDEAKAIAVLEKKYGPEIAEAAAPRSLSQASMDRALKTLGKPLAPLHREAMAAIEAVGGVRKGTTVQVRPMKFEGAAKTFVLRVEQQDGTVRPKVLPVGEVG
jgi:hypothetical protein